MSTCFPKPQKRMWIGMAPVSKLPLEGFLPKVYPDRKLQCHCVRGAVTDMATHTGLWLEKNETEIVIKGIHVRNGFKPCYLLPRQQMEKHLLFCLTTDKNNGWPRTVYVNESKNPCMQHMTKLMNIFLFENTCAFKKPRVNRAQINS